MSMARITSPRSRYWSYSSCMAGISSRHGAHHVAQKLMSTGLPLSWARLMDSPSTSCSLKSGAGLPRRATGWVPQAAAASSASANPPDSAARTRWPAQDRETLVIRSASVQCCAGTTSGRPLEHDAPVEVLRQAQEQAGEHEHAHRDQERSADRLDHAEVAVQSLEKQRRRAEREGCDQERYAEPQRAGREQHGALRHGVGERGQTDDPGQDWAD